MTEKRVTQVIAEVAEVPATTQRRVSQVIAEVAYVPSQDASTAPTTGTGSAAGGGGTPVLSPEKAPQWTIDGKPAAILWDSVTMRANGGYEQANFRLAATKPAFGRAQQVGPYDFGQGSIIRAIRDNGDIFWEGTVAAPPQRFQGETKFWGLGAVEVIRRMQKRLAFQLRGGSGWVDRSSDPFNYSQSEKYELFSKDNLIGWVIDTRSYSNGNKSGFVLMVSNANLKRIAFTINKSGDNSNFDLALYTGDDAGTLSLENSWTMGAAHPDGDTIDYNLSSQKNTMSLVITANGSTTPGSRTRIWLTQLRVNGIGTDDTYTTSDVLSTLGNRCDYDTTNVESSPTAAIPLDWDGPWSDLADNMAEMDDWFWLVGADEKQRDFGVLTYAPYGGIDEDRIWRGVRGEGLDCDLTVLPLYNHVDVEYESPAGVPQTLERDAADVGDLDDPVPDDIYPFTQPFSIEDTQNDSHAARALADGALRRLTKLRAIGSITVSSLENGRPYDVFPGDLIKIGSFDPDLPPQRIVGVEYKSDGTVRLDIGRSLTIEDIAANVLRRRYKKRRS